MRIPIRPQTLSSIDYELARVQHVNGEGNITATDIVAAIKEIEDCLNLPVEELLWTEIDVDLHPIPGATSTQFRAKRIPFVWTVTFLYRAPARHPIDAVIIRSNMKLPKPRDREKG